MLRVALILAMLSSAAAAACVNGLWVTEVYDGGALLAVSDGSIWQIESIYKIDVRFWLRTEDLIICEDGKIINTDTGEAVYARKLR